MHRASVGRASNDCSVSPATPLAAQASPRGVHACAGAISRGRGARGLRALAGAVGRHGYARGIGQPNPIEVLDISLNQFSGCVPGSLQATLTFPNSNLGSLQFCAN